MKRPAKTSTWRELSDDELLDVRLSQLGLDWRTSPIAESVERLYGELESRGISFRPHVWLSNSWFSPDGVPGIAVPFYLADPRLARLEERATLEVEGTRRASCMRLLRHEAGHAIATAFGLSREREFRALFGAASRAYRASYRPRPFRREFVLHLDHWYAQSHAAEDFAETFAVWLDPRSRWRERYGDWPAIHKLEYVERAAARIAGERARRPARERCWELADLSHTLRQHHASKRSRYARRRPLSVDRELALAFRPLEPGERRLSPTHCIARLRGELARRIDEREFEERYTVEQVVRSLVHRAFQLGLSVDPSEPKATLRAIAELGHTWMRSLRSGRLCLMR